MNVLSWIVEIVLSVLSILGYCLLIEQCGMPVWTVGIVFVLLAFRFSR